MQQPQTLSAAVRNLQTYLRQISYHDPEITPPPIDGIFGNETRRSLCEFQKRSGMPVSGVADRATWDALYAAYRLSLAENAMPCRVALFPPYPNRYCLKRGCRDFSVAALQYMLRELQQKTGDGIPIEINGVFDDATEEAVRAFQECCSGLECSGEADRKTWNEIAERYNALFERPPCE